MKSVKAGLSQKRCWLERTGIAGVADIKRNMRLIKEAAAAEMNGGQRLIDDAGFQQRMADIEVELMALEFTELRTLATMAQAASQDQSLHY